ncbi:hypothetical protein TNCV_1152691 [Trichonephila clavipes]|nr:hypothetical protein TNCV_1152691 [Trichonephila clavipes]
MEAIASEAASLNCQTIGPITSSNTPAEKLLPADTAQREAFAKGPSLKWNRSHLGFYILWTDEFISRW